MGFHLLSLERVGERTGILTVLSDVEAWVGERNIVEVQRRIQGGTFEIGECAVLCEAWRLEFEKSRDGSPKSSDK